ncbi:hypothetical protein [Reyranella sp.]|uniref:hypothetical protein n=1 Tax=Reyranella sp. TaxID=1929291 RepID=UPI003D0CA306
MAVFASQIFERTKRLIFLVLRRPHYLLGRFAIIRDAYSGLKGLKDFVVQTPPLLIGDLYKPATTAVDVAYSGHVLPSRSPAEQVEEMKVKSYSLGPQLDSAALAMLQDEAQKLPLHVDDKTVGTYSTLSREKIAIATVEDSSKLPLIRAIASDAFLYTAASLFLGYRPRQVSIWFFWSLANQLSADQRRAAYQTIDFHYDVDGFNFMYANFYLLDTTAQNGAHSLITGSSRRKRLGHLLGIARLNDAEAFEAYGRDAVRTLEGPAGFGFLEDASCYHKAIAPESGDRLMLQLRYQ